MSFLDNSGDIILDAVLTDTGRMRLAKGDGSFRITKFALSDDEINYELYRNDNHKDAAHPSGSAYYDLQILQTPVLEAFTNNTALLKSKLVSITRTNLLYLPVLLVNNTSVALSQNGTYNQFIVAVDTDTTDQFDFTTDNTVKQGVIRGTELSVAQIIQVDQGLDTDDVHPAAGLSADLLETQYMIEMDHRLGGIHSGDGTAPLKPSFVDDDNVASYYLSQTTKGNFISTNTSTDKINPSGGAIADQNQVIKGPRGTSLRFTVSAGTDLRTSTFLFEKLGSEIAAFGIKDGGTTAMRTIDTTIRITGITTGYRIDIPFKFIKKK